MSTVTVTEAPDPLVGRLIDGKYQVLEPLGEGGMALVYTALHLTLEHLVAIKFLRKELANEPDVAERFARESRTIAQLNSEHIVKMLDVGHLDGAGLYMVMEHLAGEDLLTRLRRTGPLSLAEATKYVTQAALGLHQAHEKGIVHRDLKPENLFLARTGKEVEVIKVLDFGISKQTSAAVTRLTQPQMALGSPAYMAPEQLMGSDHIDARADVWSLGVVLYQLVTGVLPFPGLSVAEVYVNILHTEPLPPSHFCPELPRAFDDLVLRCLAKPVEQRPPSVRAFALELKDVVSGRSRSGNIAGNIAGNIVAHATENRSSSVAPVSVATRLSIERFGAARRWRVIAAVGGLLLGTVGTLALATNSLTLRAEPIRTLAGGGADITSIEALRVRPPARVDIADLPIEPAAETRHPEPKATPARLPKQTEPLKQRSKAPGGALGRLPAAAAPKRSGPFAVSDFGGRT